MEDFICTTCGAQYPPSEHPPARCVICEDDRQYVNPRGQQWTTLARMQGDYHNRFEELEPGLTAIRTEPKFAIGERGLLVQTPHGNLLWDCFSYLDEQTVQQVKDLGGIAAIAISHPHFYTTMWEWSAAFDDAPVYVHADDQAWAQRPARALRPWDGDQLEVLPGLRLLHCGGHFPGSTALHWSAGAEGRGVLLAGDTVLIGANHGIVTFMYSYPNLIPLSADQVRRIAATLEPYPFDRLYDGWNNIRADAYRIVQESAVRYIEHLTSA